jgi:hypothetical protein
MRAIDGDPVCAVVALDDRMPAATMTQPFPDGKGSAAVLPDGSRTDLHLWGARECTEARAMTERNRRSGGEVRLPEPTPRLVTGDDLCAQWKAILAMQRADRRRVVVVTVGPRARPAGAPAAA